LMVAEGHSLLHIAAVRAANGMCRLLFAVHQKSTRTYDKEFLLVREQVHCLKHPPNRLTAGASPGKVPAVLP
jgi:hypothetical protein